MILLTLRFNKLSLVITFILGLGILPATSFMGLALPWQYVVVPLMLYVLLFTFFGWIPIPRFAKVLTLFWIVIVLEVIFSATFSPLITLGDFVFPRESIQYIARLLFFVTFIAFFYNYNINYERFFKGFIVVLLLGMGVGVIQFFDFGALSDTFRKLYSFSDRHYNAMINDNISSRRISGVAHFATANGGIAAFTFVMILAMYMFHKKNRMLTLAGLLLVVFNIVAAQARMGYLTLAFAVIAFYFVYNTIYKKGIRSTITLAILISSISAILYWLYARGNEFITKAVFRWERLGEQVAGGGNRYGQVFNALDQIKNPWDFMFGISRGVENTLENFYMEIEPFNIFVLYGAFGLVLQYSLVLILLIYFYKNFRVVKHHPILLTMVVASFVSLLSYQFFSAAYFFFREVYVGLFPWILMGATIGVVERFKKSPEIFKDEKKELKTKPRKRYKVVWK